MAAAMTARQVGQKARTASAGSCDAFATDSGLDPQGFSATNELTIARLDLPPGAYVLHAKVLVGNRATSPNEDFSCTLRHGPPGFGQLVDSAGVRLFGGAPDAPGSFATLPLLGAVDVTTNDTFAVVCATTSGDAFAQYAQLVAIRVDSLTTQP